MINTKEFLEVCDYHNLLRAAKIARKNKLHIPGQREFFSNIEENLINLQNELVWRLYFPQMPVPAFKDVVVQIALFTRLSRNLNLIRDFYVFALFENVVFSKIIQSGKKMLKFINPGRPARPGRRRHHLPREPPAF